MVEEPIFSFYYFWVLCDNHEIRINETQYRKFTYKKPSIIGDAWLNDTDKIILVFFKEIKNVF